MGKIFRKNSRFVREIVIKFCMKQIEPLGKLFIQFAFYSSCASALLSFANREWRFDRTCKLVEHPITINTITTGVESFAFVSTSTQFNGGNTLASSKPLSQSSNVHNPKIPTVSWTLGKVYNELVRASASLVTCIQKGRELVKCPS